MLPAPLSRTPPVHNPTHTPPEIDAQRENESLSARLKTLSVELEKEKKKPTVINHPAADAVEEASSSKHRIVGCISRVRSDEQEQWDRPFSLAWHPFLLQPYRLVCEMGIL